MQVTVFCLFVPYRSLTSPNFFQAAPRFQLPTEWTPMSVWDETVRSGLRLCESGTTITQKQQLHYNNYNYNYNYNNNYNWNCSWSRTLSTLLSINGGTSVLTQRADILNIYC